MWKLLQSLFILPFWSRGVTFLLEKGFQVDPAGKWETVIQIKSHRWQPGFISMNEVWIMKYTCITFSTIKEDIGSCLDDSWLFFLKIRWFCTHYFLFKRKRPYCKLNQGSSHAACRQDSNLDFSLLYTRMVSSLIRYSMTILEAVNGDAVLLHTRWCECVYREHLFEKGVEFSEIVSKWWL